MSEPYNNDPDTVKTLNLVRLTLKKQSAARITKALKQLEEFSLRTLNLKERWAQYCEARNNEAVEDNHFVDHFNDVLDFDDHPQDAIHGMEDYIRF